MRRAQRGISLIESMLSVAIGLVVVGALLVAYLGSGQASRSQSALSRMNQDAQFALTLLGRELQLAGFSQPLALANVAPNGQPPLLAFVPGLGAQLPVFACDGGFVNAAILPAVGPLQCAAGGQAALAVAYEADTSNTVARGAAGALNPTDCLGGQINNPGGIAIALNRYYIAQGPANRPELYCASGNTGQSQPLVQDVEGMDLWWGIQSAASPRQVARYVKAGTDAATADTINALGAAEWANVISVRVCLLLRSTDPVLVAGEDSLQYMDCNGVVQTSNDGRLRRAYFSTSSLRARIL